MRARHLEYVDALHHPAVLSWAGGEISYANGAAQAALLTAPAKRTVVHMLDAARDGRRAVEARLGDDSWIALPLFHASGTVEDVLAVPGTFGDIPLLLQALNTGLRHVDELLHVLPNALLTARPDGRFDFANRRWYEKTGPAVEGKPVDDDFWRHVDERDIHALRGDWSACIAQGQAFRRRFRVGLANGEYHWHELRANPWIRRRLLIKWIVTITDVHDSVLAEQSSSKLMSHLRLLAEIGNVLAETKEIQTTLERVAELVAHAFAGSCRIDAFGEGSAEARAEPARGKRSIAAWAPQGIGFVEFLSPAAGEPRSIIVLPLEGLPALAGLPRGRALLARESNGVALSDDDYATFEAIVARTASALALAAHARRTDEIATELQLSMLPASMPSVPGVLFDVCYRPAEEQTLVGGDWYDAFLLPRGKAAIMIGDVTGHGIQAAITMNRLRQSLRTIAMEVEDPAAILRSVNRLAMAEGDPTATALIAILDPVTFELSYAGAGHPPGYLVSPNGETVPLNSSGPPLSVVDDYPYTTTSLTIDQGQALVLCTDGLIEFERDVVLGEQRLVSVLTDWARGGFAGDAAAIESSILGDHPTADDAALLVARFPRVQDLELTIPATTFDARRARIALRRFVEGSPLSGPRAADIVLAGSEAVANSVRHAYRGGAGSVVVAMHLDAAEVRITVSDSGAWQERDTTNLEGGRGLHIMRSLADTMRVERSDTGTTVHLSALLDGARASLAGRPAFSAQTQNNR